VYLHATSTTTAGPCATAACSARQAGSE